MKASWAFPFLLLSAKLSQAQTGAWPYSQKLDSSAVPSKIRKVMHTFSRKPDSIVWQRKFGNTKVTHSFTAYFRQHNRKYSIEISPKGNVLSFQHPVALSACPIVVRQAISKRIKTIQRVQRAADVITVKIVEYRLGGETAYGITYHKEISGKSWEVYDSFYFDKDGKEEK